MSAVLLRVPLNELGPVLADARFHYRFPCIDPKPVTDWEYLHEIGVVYTGPC